LGTRLSKNSSPEHQRGSLFGFPLFFKENAFTLVELLVVIFIMTSMVSVLELSLRSSWIESGNEKSVAREAEYFSSWVNRILFKACLNRRSFQFVHLPCSTPVSTIYVRWSDGTTEVYDSGGKCYFTVRGHSVTSSTYTPQWHMLTPGFTLKAVVSPSRLKAIKYIRISPHCFVSVTDDPPED
jgi:hypothetical protein